VHRLLSFQITNLILLGQYYWRLLHRKFVRVLHLGS